MKKICVVIGSRANYSSIKSAMRAIDNHENLELNLLVGASAILDRYGGAIELIRNDGFKPMGTFHMLIEGGNPSCMAKSTGLGLIEIPSLLEKLSPDMVLTVGDRFETMATTLAAAYMNIPIAHTMGGEVSGTIDESIRHAITKFAHLHFPASESARQRIIKLGEVEENVFMVGCPRIDLIAEQIKNKDFCNMSKLFSKGVGATFDINKPFLVLSQHPVTTEFGNGEEEIKTTLEVIKEINIPAIVLWPNSDAGSDDISRGIRKWREQNTANKMHFFKNLPVNEYITLLFKTSCLIGNSSSGIREGAFIGTPVVNIGSRQNNRERGKNVMDVSHNKKDIKEAIIKQINHGKYQKDTVYGDGNAGIKIADILSQKNIKVQKCITY